MVNKSYWRPLNRVCVGAVIFGALFMLPHVALAKGPFGRVMISGGQPPFEIATTDPALLAFFSFSEFHTSHIPAPQVAEPGYVVTRGWIRVSGEFEAVDRLRYYPSTTPGQRGYVFYEGLINGGSEYDQRWYWASTNGDEAMRRLIDSQQTSRLQTPNQSAMAFVLVLTLSVVVSAALVGQLNLTRTDSYQAANG